MNATGALSLSSIPAVTGIVLLTMALNASVNVGAVDLYGAAITGDTEGELHLEYSTNGSTWTRAGPTVPVYATARDVRLPVAPDMVKPVTHLRLVIDNGSPVSGEAFSASSVTVLTQAAPDGNIRFWPFSAPEGAAYMLAVTGGNADVYRDGGYKASIPLPYSTSQVLRVRTDKRLDTLIASHENVPEHLVIRDDADDAWISRPAVFKNVPLEQFEGETYTNGKNEKQVLFFRGFSGGDTFNIVLDGERTSNVAVPASFTGIETAVKSALEALDNLGAGQTICTKTGNKEVTVEFTGDAGQKDWPQMFISVVDSTDGVGVVSTIQEGEEGGEAMISPSRGYSRCAMFWSGRTNLLGLKALPLTGIATQYGDYFNFNQGSARATDGLEYLIDSDDDDGVRAVQKKARHPLLFTSSGCWYLPVDALSGETPPGALPASQVGFEDVVPPLAFDGGTMFVQYGGTIVNYLEWTGGDGEWVASDVSVRASHLIVRPVDAAVRESARGYKSALYHLIREDGEVASFVSKRSENVAGWARMTTPAGRILAMKADKLGRIYAAVRRVAGETVHWTVETESAALTLDGGAIVELDNEDTIAAPQLDGLPVWVTDGNNAYGPVTVSGGEIVLDEPLTGSVEYGLLYDAWIEPQDVRGNTEIGSLAGVLKHVQKVRVKLLSSLPPKISIYDKAWPMEVSADAIQEGLDTTAGPIAGRITGWVEQDDFDGDGETADFRLYRHLPGPFRIQAIKTTINIPKED
ncbi:MAG: hypothetical protein WA989_09365 [Henriciella sp.]|uniref:hypothetical protein n=1 Tax=Henriciella sp. TaxID=1968823 RepID=UPI003C7499FB